MAGLWKMRATQLAALIHDRQVSVGEVIQMHLRRIDAVNPALNAIVIRLDEQALAVAGAAGGGWRRTRQGLLRRPGQRLAAHPRPAAQAWPGRHDCLGRGVDAACAGGFHRIEHYRRTRPLRGPGRLALTR